MDKDVEVLVLVHEVLASGTTISGIFDSVI